MPKAQQASSPSECNCSALRQATRVVTRGYDEALAPLGLGASQYAVLATLGRSGPLILRELAAALVMDRSTVGHMLRPLEGRGLVAIETGPRDGRERVVALSPAGQDLLAEARPLWAAAQARFEARFGASDAEALRSVLARVVAADGTRTGAIEERVR